MAAAATPQAVPSPRTPERRYGSGSEVAPHLKGSEVCQGRRGGARESRRVTTTEAPSPGILQEDAKEGARPGSVTDPVPHGRVVRHTVEHRIDQVVELLQKIVTASLVEPVQVIAVPKISLDRISQRSAQTWVHAGSPRLEVFLEACEVRGILSGQGSTASGAELIVDTPVPQGRWVGGGGLRASPRTEFDSCARGADR